MATATRPRVLSNDILVCCAERAPLYDQDNRFFDEDFAELRQAGYRVWPCQKSWAALA